MSRTYQIVQTPGGMWQILSNGKPLRWYYRDREYAEHYVFDLKFKDQQRQQQVEWRKEHGIKPQPRDSLRSKVYAAERRVPGLIGGPHLGQNAAELGAKCVRWAQMIGLTQVTHAPTIKFSSRKRGAHAWMNSITLGTLRDLGTLVHEYAHCLTWAEQPAHGPRWADTYVKLVAVVFDPTWPGTSEKLRREFTNIGLLQEAAA